MEPSPQLPCAHGRTPAHPRGPPSGNPGKLSVFQASWPVATFRWPNSLEMRTYAHPWNCTASTRFAPHMGTSGPTQGAVEWGWPLRTACCASGTHLPPAACGARGAPQKVGYWEAPLSNAGCGGPVATYSTSLGANQENVGLRPGPPGAGVGSARAPSQRPVFPMRSP